MPAGQGQDKTVALELPKLAPKLAPKLPPPSCVGIGVRPTGGIHDHAAATGVRVGTRVFKAILGLLGCWSGWIRSA